MVHVTVVIVIVDVFIVYHEITVSTMTTRSSDNHRNMVVSAVIVFMTAIGITAVLLYCNSLHCCYCCYSHCRYCHYCCDCHCWLVGRQCRNRNDRVDVKPYMLRYLACTWHRGLPAPCTYQCEPCTETHKDVNNNNGHHHHQQQQQQQRSSPSTNKTTE